MDLQILEALVLELHLLDEYVLKLHLLQSPELDFSMVKHPGCPAFISAFIWLPDHYDISLTQSSARYFRREVVQLHSVYVQLYL